MEKKLLVGLVIGVLSLLQSTVYSTDCISGHWLSIKKMMVQF